MLARWSGWGSLPEVFDDRSDHSADALRARELLDGRARAAAARTTLNAHYTDASLVRAVWSALGQAGFDESAGGRVLEPGCGSGTFIGFAPDHVRDVVGIELDPTTARIASLLYPSADVRAESFAETRLPAGGRDLVIGNVPFADVVPHDSTYNRDRMSLHNYFIYKSLHLVRPGGVVAVLTSRWTMDSTNPQARTALAGMADLVSAIRLPERAHWEAAGTQVVTDLLVLRRRLPGEDPAGLERWRDLAALPSESAGTGLEEQRVDLNELYVDDPARVLGQSTSKMGRFGPEPAVLPPATEPGQRLADEVARQLERQLSQDLASYAAQRPLFTPLSGAGQSMGSTARPEPTNQVPRPRRPKPSSDSRGRSGGVVEEPLVLPASVVRAEGHISAGDGEFADDLGGWTQVHDGVPEPMEVPKSQANELRMLVGLRDTVVTLLEVEATTPLPGDLPAGSAAAAAGDDQMIRLRERLNRQYDAYLKRYGPINRVTSRKTGRTDPKTGEPVLAQVRPRQGGFRTDPHSPAVFALEHYDSATGTATRADIFAERVVAPRVLRTHAETPADAIALCLETYGEIRTGEIARLLGIDAAAAEVELEAFAFLDPTSVVVAQGTPEGPDRPSPEPGRNPVAEGPAGEGRTERGQGREHGGGRWVPAAEFLSGNVRARLAEVESKLDELSLHGLADPEVSPEVVLRRLEAGKRALEGVLPADLGPTEIVAQLGVPWVPAEVVRQFLSEILEDNTVKVEHPGGSVWAVNGNKRSVAAATTWGTKRCSAIEIAQACLEQRQVRVTDQTTTGQRIPNETETFAAQEKAEALQERFGTWLWEEPERCRQMVRAYNDAFNAIVLRSYDVDETKTYPGMARNLRLRPHQHAAVARMVAQPSVLLAHEVGAGKTLEAICGTSELRRLALVRKPAIVVPNHMLEQFSREWLQAYPQARVLTCGTEDLVKEKRRLFVARAATGEWDAVIMSRSAFERIPVSKETEADYFDEQLNQMRVWLAASKGGDGLTVKRLEGTLARAEERLKGLRDVDRDPAITFESTGIDYLVVDEAHGYKNLRLASNIPGVAVDGSNRATDLDLKMNYLRERHGRRVATFMTATPIANSVAEAYTMLRYLAPAEMEAAGITDFDTWAATFGQVVTELELSPSGTGFKMKSRFARFNNVPELLKLWHQVADVKTGEDLNLPIPALAGGAAETVVVPPGELLIDFMRTLAQRADAVATRKVRPEEDNMLRISSHGRAAALDLRLVTTPFAKKDPETSLSGMRWASPHLEPEPGKLDAVATRVAEIYHDHAEARFGSDPEPGALQLVFCDLGTPTSSGWNAYEELRSQLVDRGVPEAKVRFMHEATNDRAKARMFEQARSGHIAVLVGSTEKMGVGTNVQKRAVALHHVDCPWRPADLAQRDGRIMRQGNLNDQVKIFRYVTEASFDTFLWQTVERKAKFINQLMRGRLDVREIEDIGDSALSFAEVKALASGDPRIMELAKAETDVTKLERLERAWSHAQASLRSTIREAGPRLEKLHAGRAQLEAAIPQRRDTDGDAFSMRIGQVTYSKRADAAPALLRAVTAVEPYQRDPVPVGEVAGLHLQIAADGWSGEHRWVISLVEVPQVFSVIEERDVRAVSTGLVTRVENLPRKLERALGDVTFEAERTSQEATKAKAALEETFPRQAELDEARDRRDGLSAALAAESAKKEKEAAAGADQQGAPNGSGTALVDRPGLAPPGPAALGLAVAPESDEPRRSGPRTSSW